MYCTLSFWQKQLQCNKAVIKSLTVIAKMDRTILGEAVLREDDRSSSRFFRSR